MIIVLATVESSVEDINNLHQAIVDMQTATIENEPGNISYTSRTDRSINDRCGDRHWPKNSPAKSVRLLRPP